MRRDIEFASGGDTCRGWLYLPEGDGPHPVAVLAGGWCYVRELVMPHYAEAFAAAGIAALVFDYRCLGVSDGMPRQHLDPWAQVEDYRNAISFAERQPELDAERIAVWGISYSGGHALILAASDRRVKAAVSMIPVIDGYKNMRRVHGTLGFRKLRDLIDADRAARYRDPAAVGYLPHAVDDPHETVSAWPFPETYTTFKALQETEAPLYENRSTIESVDLLMGYSVAPFTSRILDVPTLMIVAEGDDLTLWDLEIGAFNDIPTARKRLVVLPDTGHMTLYSNRQRLELAAGEATAWFRQHLLA